MERLTDKAWRNMDPWECCGQDNHCARGCHEEGGCTKGCAVPQIYSKLAGYEDTGLTPEEIKKLKADRDNWKKEAVKATAQLGEMKIAEGQGLLIKLPCKVGESVWIIVNTELFSGNIQSIKIISVEVVEIRTNRLHGIWYIAKSKYAQYDFAAEEIGKIVFLTREAAEEALKGGV